MSADRDEMAEDLQEVIEGGDAVYDDMVDALKLRGWSKARVIETEAEREAFQNMTVVRTDAGSIANIVDDRAYFFGYEASVPAKMLALPITILWTATK